MRWIALLLLLLAPTAAARAEFVVAPAEIELAREGLATLTLTASGSDADGGVYDVLWETDAIWISFEGGHPPQGITYLPGQPMRASWSVRIGPTDAAQPGEHVVAFRLVERPSPNARPVAVEAAARVLYDLDASVAPRIVTDEGRLAAPPTSSDRWWYWGGIASLLAGVAWAWRRGWFAAALYSRQDDSETLRHPIRSRMFSQIEATPGTTPAQLQRALGLSDGQLDHHLRKLVAAGFIVKVKQDGARLLFVAGSRPPVDVMPLSSRIRDVLALGGVLTASEVASRVGTSPQHARYYLEKLRREGLADVEWRGLRRAYRLDERT